MTKTVPKLFVNLATWQPIGSRAALVEARDGHSLVAGEFLTPGTPR